MKLLLTLGFSLLSTNLLALTIGAYNIRNFDYDQRYRISTNKSALTSILQEVSADVLSVEEINNTLEFERYVEKNLPGYDVELTRCGGAHGQRLGFIFNTKVVDLLAFNEDLSISNPNGQGGCDTASRPMAIGLFQVKATKQRFYGITVHLKSGSHPESMRTRHAQFKVIKETILDLKKRTGVQDFFVAGDMNTTEYTNKGADYKALTKTVSELNMIDLSANEKCTAYWWGGTDDGVEAPSLLDHVIATPGLVKVRGARTTVAGHCKKVSCRSATPRELGISYESVSDHCPVFAKIQ